MKDKVQGARWAPVFFLRRALSESKPGAQLELSASHTCALNESKPETQHEFSAAGSAERLGNEPKAQLELSASQFGTLNECKPKAKQEFSERNKQSI